MWRLRGPVRCVWGLLEPPIYLGSKFSPKIMFSWKEASIQMHLNLLKNIFSITLPKISENWRSTEKLLTMSEIYKICNFWPILTCNTSKNKAFFHRIQFQTKKVSFIWKNVENPIFSIYFSKSILARNFKTEFIYTLEMFWK